jgi:hypothetical protein
MGASVRRPKNMGESIFVALKYFPTFTALSALNIHRRPPGEPMRKALLAVAGGLESKSLIIFFILHYIADRPINYLQ